MVMTFNESQIDKIAGKEFRRISVCKKKNQRQCKFLNDFQENIN